MTIETTFDDRITMHIVTAHHEIELLHPNVVFESYNEDVIRTGSQQVNRVTSDLDRVLLNAMTLLAAWDHATAYRASDEYKERVAREEAEKEARAQVERAASQFETEAYEALRAQQAKAELDARAAQLDRIATEVSGGKITEFEDCGPFLRSAVVRLARTERENPVEAMWDTLFTVPLVTPDSVWSRISEFGK